MVRIEYSNKLVKKLFKQDNKKDQIEAYRYWCIARQYFSDNAGIFNLDEFCNVLNKDYDYKSLIYNSNRNKFKKKLTELFQESILFMKVEHEKAEYLEAWRLLSETRFFDKRYTIRLKIEQDELKSRKKFLDKIIGMSEIYEIKSVSRVQKQTGLSARRIKYANKRNHENKSIAKINNCIIIETSENPTELRAAQKKIYLAHGILTLISKFFHKGKIEYILSMYTSNSYQWFDTTETKDAHIKINGLNKVRENLDKKYIRFWEFTENYTFMNYLDDYGFHGVGL